MKSYYRMETCGINNISLSGFDDKIYILKNRYEIRVIRVIHEKKIYFNNYSEKLFVKLQKF